MTNEPAPPLVDAQRMVGRLVRWFAPIPEPHHAVRAAIERFEATTGKLGSLRNSVVIATTNKGYVVRVEHVDDAKPPDRSWYFVGSDGAGVVEMSFDQAQEHGEKTWA